MAEEKQFKLSDFGYTSSNLPTDVDTRNLRPAFEMPELNIAPITYPDEITYPSETPKEKEVRSKTELPSIVDKIRQSVGVTFADKHAMTHGIGSDLIEASKPKGLVLHREDTKLSEVYDTLSDGSFVPRYKSFISGTNNEERLARKQGKWEKWGHGLSKLVAKTSLYTVGGVANPVYGAIEAIKTGNFNAVYNNDFMDWVNDQDTKLNYSLPNYYTQAEKNRSFGGKMLTANFWANDVLGGMAFTFGALGTEAILAYATGGASLAATAGRIGLRAAGKTAGKLLAKEGLSSVKSAANAYLRSASKASNIAAAVNNGRFIMTSAGWEASVEASHYMKEAELNYVNSYRNTYGKNPTAQELEKFRSAAAGAGNTVFAANIGIVGLSNLLQFGQYFGAGIDVAGKMDRSINKFFGLGARFNKAGNLERISASKFRKFLGGTYNVFKRPFTEGVWEEGGQGTVSAAAKAWIGSRYNTDAITKNIGVIDALKDGFAQTYGTPEGRMEVGIGALIGGIMGVGGLKHTGFGGITEYKNQSLALDAAISNYNELAVPQAGLDVMSRFATLNQQLTALENGTAAEEAGDAYTSRREYDTSLFSKFKMESDLGMLDDGVKNFEHIIRNMDNADIAKEYGISEFEAEELKKRVVEDYNERLEDFRASTELASSIGANAKPEYRDYLAMNVFLGIRAKKSLNETAEAIGDMLGNRVYSDALKFYSDLSEEGRILMERKTDLSYEVERLEKEIQKLNSGVIDESSKAEYAKKVEELTGINQRIQEIDNELAYQKSNQLGSYANAVPVSEYSFNGREFRELDNIVRALRRTKDPANKARADKLDALVVEFAKLYADSKSVNEMLARIADRRFLAEEERGIMKLFRGEGIQYNESEADPNIVAVNQEVEEKIKKGLADGTISEEEAYTLHTFNRMNLGFVRRDPNTDIDPITDEQWQQYNDGLDLDSLYNQVADKIHDEVQLSPREKRIYDDNKAVIDDINVKKGDSPMSRLRKIREKLKSKDNTNIENAKEANDKVIDDALKESTEDERKEIEEAINLRNELLDKADEGQDVDQDEIDNLNNKINQFGQDRDIDGLTDFVEQNRMLSKGETAFTPTRSVTDMTDLVDHTMPPGTSRGAVSFDNAQNIEMITAKKDKSGNNMIISGVRPGTLAGIITERMGGRIIKQPKEGGGAWEIEVQGLTLKLYPNAEHSTTKISMADIELLEQHSIDQGFGFIFTRQPALAGANSREVLWLDIDQSLSIIPTNTKYGKNGKDVISDEDVLNTKVGDRLIARIDFEDSYNKSLLSRYNSALKKYEKAVSDSNADPENEGKKILVEEANTALESAKKSIRNNLVVKLINNEKGDSRFVSVAKALPSTTSNAPGGKALLEMREKAYNMYMANAGSRKTGYMDVGTYVVRRTLPGRPSLNMRLQDGNIVVENIPVSSKAAESIVTVGYMINGRFHTKDKASYSSHPFMSLASRNSRRPGDKYYDTKIPFVVIKHPNGTNYAYPVEANVKDNTPEILAYAAELRSDVESHIIQEIGIDRDNIIAINTKAMSFGIDPSSMIRLTGTYAEIESDMEKLAAALESYSGAIDVNQWLTSDRSAKDIAMSDTKINIDLSTTPFHAPKLVVDFVIPGSTTESVVSASTSSSVETDVVSVADILERSGADSDLFANIVDNPFDNAVEGTDNSQAESEIKKPC